MRHVLIARSKRKFLGTGAIGTAPPPASVAVGSLWVDGAVVYQDKYVFKNSGVDRISLGRPTALINLLALGSDFIVTGLYNPNPSVIGSVVALSGGAGTEQMNMIHFGTDYIACRVGGASAQRTVTANSGVWNKSSIVKTGSIFYASNNGVNSSTISCGTETYSGDITIGGRMDGSVNFEGNTAFVGFYTSAGVLVDMIDFNDQTRWNGGLSGTTWAGNPFAFTDGSPTGVRVQDWVPINL